MKSYKLVNSREVQEKALRLGYEIGENSLVGKPLVYLENNRIFFESNPTDWSLSNHKEITQADFLALPEPVKEGDWVSWSLGFLHIGKVESINDSVCNIDGLSGIKMIDTLTKLTPEQIEILELEK